eukprot:CAMPEP_0176400870 /NCGR_PEP_ID=MMETSP0126-20121128/47971_1 /TAXON_ID=141414 ORGANISM="Strombidinopsis acuminatum, Strain SPMC142" /NCGR_SAMPLE_ID=MMETSP0126 /ASSEMBLY_ACC=CAM_ASM_000229 /LENGTH=60 /DNA_ID=CAMNT_0017777441 /DNA_START=603 /DNA_END=785 /DNA_ORIENTATION=-
MRLTPSSGLNEDNAEQEMLLNNNEMIQSVMSQQINSTPMTPFKNTDNKYTESESDMSPRG